MEEWKVGWGSPTVSFHPSTLPAFHSLVRAFACVWESGTFGSAVPRL
jgi:hypothetical protein